MREADSLERRAGALEFSCCLFVCCFAGLEGTVHRAVMGASLVSAFVRSFYLVVGLYICTYASRDLWRFISRSALAAFSVAVRFIDMRRSWS